MKRIADLRENGTLNLVNNLQGESFQQLNSITLNIIIHQLSEAQKLHKSILLNTPLAGVH